MKKIKHENELLKEAIKIGGRYFEKRGVGRFEETDGADTKVTAIYRLLVHDNLIQPLAKGEDNLPNMRHKLALWMAKNLPKDHPLLH